MRSRKPAVRFRPGFGPIRLAILCVCALPVFAQSSSVADAKPAADRSSVPAPARIHGTLRLDGPWRFQAGDDPRWGDPGFDDSGWTTVTLNESLREQGIASFTGYSWYRLKIRPEELAQFQRTSDDAGLELLVTGYFIGQVEVFVDGVDAAHTRGMTDRPTSYQSPPLAVDLPAPGADGTIVVAIRCWADPGVPVQHGLVSKVELGARDDVAYRLSAEMGRLWSEHAIAGLVASFLFLCVALLGTTVYLTQRGHPEYLWLGLLCLTVAFMGTSEVSFSLGLAPWPVFRLLSLWNGRVFMVVALEFILRFTESEYRKLVRIVQVAAVLVPFLYLGHLQTAYEYLSVGSEVVFSAVVTVLLFVAWRRGRVDAGVMLAPFILAASADSLDTVLGYAASKRWIGAQFAAHRFHVGPVALSTGDITYTVFLGSLLGVILYRFIHVSQEEQKSAAELEAARSVQALLIPTQLPSNRHFVLDSAYLPVNGVGGDFFQVLPLKDGSRLIVVGDVSGKGLQAAMNASTLVGALRNELSHEPATVLDRLNQVLLGAVTGLGSGPGHKAAASFATCLCARVYPDGTMTISNAGHLSPYRNGREMELGGNLPLGVIGNIRYEQVAVQLDVGDRLVFLSDGVVEASNAQGELFGFERTQDVSNEPAHYIAQTAKRFGQNDDITVVCLYFNSRSERAALLEEAPAG